jgi:hypothetical protein
MVPGVDPREFAAVVASDYEAIDVLDREATSLQGDELGPQVAHTMMLSSCSPLHFTKPTPRDRRSCAGLQCGLEREVSERELAGALAAD